MGTPCLPAGTPSMTCLNPEPTCMEERPQGKGDAVLCRFHVKHMLSCKKNMLASSVQQLQQLMCKRLQPSQLTARCLPSSTPLLLMPDAPPGVPKGCSCGSIHGEARWSLRRSCPANSMTSHANRHSAVHEAPSPPPPALLNPLATPPTNPSIMCPTQLPSLGP